jgi:hypothetical protein
LTKGGSHTNEGVLLSEGYQQGQKYSTALFYHTGIDNWGFLTHFKD